MYILQITIGSFLFTSNRNDTEPTNNEIKYMNIMTLDFFLPLSIEREITRFEFVKKSHFLMNLRKSTEREKYQNAFLSFLEILNTPLKTSNFSWSQCYEPDMVYL